MWRSFLKKIWPAFLKEKQTLAVLIAAILLLAMSNAFYAALTGPLLQMLFAGQAPAIHSAWLDKIAIYWPHARDYLNPYTFNNMFLYPLALVCVALIKGIAQTVQFSLSGQMAQRIAQSLRLRTFVSLLAQPPSFFATHHTSQLMNRLIQDCEKIELALFYGITPLVRESCLMLAMLVYCIYLNARLCIVFFLVLPALAWPLRKISIYLKKLIHQGQHELETVSFVAHESLSGIRTVQTYGMQEYQIKTFLEASKKLEKMAQKNYFIRAVKTPLMEFFGALLGALGLYFFYTSIQAKTVQASHILSFIVAAMMLYDPIKKLGQVGDFITQGLSSLERLEALVTTNALNLKNDLPIHATSSLLKYVSENPVSINFSQICFAYPNSSVHQEKTPVLNNINIQIQAGHTCALVGPSGAGKSTLMQLLLGFYRPTQGQIFINNQDTAHMDLNVLRQKSAWVSQDVFLFHASIRDNLCAGWHYTDNQIKDALQAAQALEFVTHLPDQLETIVGERGTRLSGGQKQRLAIARAFLKNAPILLLDEATSSLDSHHEKRVQEALTSLMQKRTTLVIAHRLSTVIHAQQIVVLNQGQIVQSGTHESLIKQSGLYQELITLQQLV